MFPRRQHLPTNCGALFDIVCRHETPFCQRMEELDFAWKLYAYSYSLSVLGIIANRLNQKHHTSREGLSRVYFFKYECCARLLKCVYLIFGEYEFVRTNEISLLSTSVCVSSHFTAV